MSDGVGLEQRDSYMELSNKYILQSVVRIILLVTTLLNIPNINIFYIILSIEFFTISNVASFTSSEIIYVFTIFPYIVFFHIFIQLVSCFSLY